MEARPDANRAAKQDEGAAMSEPTYIEGPADQPWTVNDSGCTIYVERRGCDDRMREVFTPPYEPAFICDQPAQAQALCDRLNALDATRAALQRLVATLTADHAINLDVKELCPEELLCKKCTAVRATLEALAAACEVLS